MSVCEGVGDTDIMLVLQEHCDCIRNTSNTSNTSNMQHEQHEQHATILLVTIAALQNSAISEETARFYTTVKQQFNVAATAACIAEFSDGNSNSNSNSNSNRTVSFNGPIQ